MAAASAYNLVGVDETGSLVNDVDGNLVGVTSPDLGDLTTNGGPTETIALQAGSPAIAAGSVALAVDAQGNPLAYDQRGVGFPRTLNGTVDIGAFEEGVIQFTPQVSVDPVNITYGTVLADSQLTGTATVTVGGKAINVAGTFTYAPSVENKLLDAGSGQSEPVIFTPANTTDYKTVTTSVIVNVAQATPDVSVNPVSITYGTASITTN